MSVAKRNVAWIRGIFDISVFEAQNNQWKVVHVPCSEKAMEFRFQVGGKRRYVICFIF